MSSKDCITPDFGSTWLESYVDGENSDLGDDSGIRSDMTREPAMADDSVGIRMASIDLPLGVVDSNELFGEVQILTVG